MGRKQESDECKDLSGDIMYLATKYIPQKRAGQALLSPGYTSAVCVRAPPAAHPVRVQPKFRDRADGFSSWHITVLVFCFVSGSGAVLLLCCLIYCRLKNTVSRSTIWNLQLSLVFFPNICMSFAFFFWGLTEGFLHETVTCCALYILRPVMLIWAFPFLKYLQDNIKTWIRFFRITSEFAVFTVIVYSVLFAYGWRKSAHDTDNGRRVASGICFGFVVLLCLFLSAGKSFCVI
ncbi:uncharacterized protein [Chanodichthys erythropterus]|uniref:uncharacterized protein n=1 Tax=Chanodichthys erythropterus TaxID=933992 RepID=UPI00351F491B